MPAVGADALYARRCGIVGGSSVHHGRPVVEQTVGLFVDGIVVRIVPVGNGGGGSVSLRNRGSISVSRGAQVFSHPALSSNLHGVINITFLVGEGGSTRAGEIVAIGINSSSETYLIPISCSYTVFSVSSHIVCGVRCQFCEAAGKIACDTSIRSVAVIGGGIVVGAPTYATRDYAYATAIGNVATTYSTG